MDPDIVISRHHAAAPNSLHRHRDRNACAVAPDGDRQAFEWPLPAAVGAGAIFHAIGVVPSVAPPVLTIVVSVVWTPR